MNTNGDNERLPLVEAAKSKLWLSAGALAVAALGYLIPDSIGMALGVASVCIELTAVLLTFATLIWTIFAIRCAYCGLHLVMFAMSKRGIGEWLHWLLTVRQCPRCGQPKHDSPKLHAD